MVCEKGKAQNRLWLGIIFQLQEIGVSRTIYRIHGAFSNTVDRGSEIQYLLKTNFHPYDPLHEEQSELPGGGVSTLRNLSAAGEPDRSVENPELAIRNEDTGGWRALSAGGYRHGEEITPELCSQ
jgi:hypothetical protein